MSCDQVATTPPALPASSADAPFRRPWTADEDQLLVDHRKPVMTNQDWIDLKPLFNGRSAAALKQRSNMIRRGEVEVGMPKRLGQPVKMPPETVREVVRMRKGGMEFTEIAAKVGFAASYCRYKYYDTQKSSRGRQRSALLAGIRRIEPRLRVMAPVEMPRPASLTAAVFGDPLPGRSALDQRQAMLKQGTHHGTADHHG